MYQSKSDLPVGEIDDEKIPTGELDKDLGREIWSEKAQYSREYQRYKFSDFWVGEVPAVKIWEMNDGRYFLFWDYPARIGFEVFETSDKAERKLEVKVSEIKAWVDTDVL